MPNKKEELGNTVNTPQHLNNTLNNSNDNMTDIKINKENKQPTFTEVYNTAEPLRSLNQHQYAELKQLNIEAHPELKIGNWYGKKILIYPTYKIIKDATNTGKIEIRQVSGQMICENGFKQSFPHISGSFYPIGCNAEDVGNHDKIYLCEGLATGDKVYTALDKKEPVLCYLSKGFLKKCLESIKSAYPNTKIVIACDTDAIEDVEKTACNYDNVFIVKPNLIKMEEAEFRKYEKREKKRPDFWDLWKVGGVDRVREELNKAYKPINYECINIANLLSLSIKPKEYVISPILKESNLIMIYAKRGVGKTLVGLEVGMSIASGTNMFDNRWKAEEQRKVLYIDGEMPAETMRKRLASIVKQKDLKQLPPDNFKLITPDLYKDPMPDLSTEEGQDKIERYIKDAEVVIIDNISTLCRTGKENDSESWNNVQGWILSLRKRNKSVILIHHAGKTGNQRGTSKREDILDTVIYLKNPKDYDAEEGARFVIEYQKARGFSGNDAKSFEVRTIESGWEVKDIEKQEEEEILELESEGYKHREIASMLELSPSKVYRVLKKHNKMKKKGGR